MSKTLEKIYTDKAPAAIGPYSQAIKCGNMLFTSGQIAINPATGNVDESDIEGQTRRICENLKAVLAEAGCTFDDAVKTTCFLKDMNDFGKFNEIYSEYFTGKPARSCVEASRLPKDVLAEIEVIAVKN